MMKLDCSPPLQFISKRKQSDDAASNKHRSSSPESDMMDVCHTPSKKRRCHLQIMFGDHCSDSAVSPLPPRSTTKTITATSSSSSSSSYAHSTSHPFHPHCQKFQNYPFSFKKSASFATIKQEENVCADNATSPSSSLKGITLFLPPSPKPFSNLNSSVTSMDFDDDGVAHHHHHQHEPYDFLHLLSPESQQLYQKNYAWFHQREMFLKMFWRNWNLDEKN